MNEDQVDLTGIVYLSRIPPCMTVKRLRQMFEKHGEVGKIFLNPESGKQKSLLEVEGKTKKKRKTNVNHFSEGWVEFMDKKVAKKVALAFNNSPIGGKRRSRFFDEVLMIKYLPKFKWGHLKERLAYEREVRKQRLREEIAKAKRETNFFKENVEKKKIEDRKNRKWKTEDVTEDAKPSSSEEPPKKLSKPNVPEKHPGRQKKKASHQSHKAAENKDFLRNLFSGGKT